MLSILIPVYNYNIVPLIEFLNSELKSVTFNFEIICFDDASTEVEISKKNEKASKINNSIYEIFPGNIGRSKVRNALVLKAKYDKLVFLDCDVLPVNKRFLQKYLLALEKENVVYGGINYIEKNQVLKKSLHYNYGKNREAKGYLKRKNSEQINFSTANFGIDKKVFSDIKFNENIISYGFEDLVFAKELTLKKYKIKQIDNSVIHNGIIFNNSDFIKKEQTSLETLNRLYDNKVLNKKDVKILYYYSFLKKSRLKNLYFIFFKMFKKLLLKNLTSNRPSLFLFDIYRLGYFSSIKKN